MKNTLAQKSLRGTSGFTLIEIMIVMVIAATLISVAWPDLKKALGRGKTHHALELQNTLNNTWYKNWTHSGGIHNTTTSNPGAMALYLINVATSAPSDAGKAPESGENWVDETRTLIGTDSVPGAIRIQIDDKVTMSGTQVLIGKDYGVTFDPKGTRDSGAFTVTVVNP